MRALSICGMILSLTWTSSVGAGEKKAVPVSVSKPVQRQVTEYADYKGRAEAAEVVDIKARVTGYLVSIHVQEGAAVKAGDLLFRIDDREAKVKLDIATAGVLQVEATLRLAKAQNNRIKQLVATNAVSREEAAQATAKEEEAQAAMILAKAKLEQARLQLDLFQIRSPIEGQIGKCFVSPGNLVQKDSTTLGVIVSSNRLKVAFTIDDITLQRVRTLKERMPDAVKAEVLIGLLSEDGYPHRALIDFVDNQANSDAKGTAARAVFANQKPVSLTPGMAVRVRLPLGGPHMALLVSETAVSAVSADGRSQYVYVVGPGNKADLREVKLGLVTDDGLREITQGLQADDQVIISPAVGLKGEPVVPREMEMPLRRPK